MRSNGRTVLNLLWTKHYRSTEASPSELGYQWQMKVRWRAELEHGMQGFGGVGLWTDWAPHSEQSHIAGPALFGRIKVGPHEAIRYNAGLLFDLTNGS